MEHQTIGAGTSVKLQPVEWGLKEIFDWFKRLFRPRLPAVIDVNPALKPEQNRPSSVIDQQPRSKPLSPNTRRRRDPNRVAVKAHVLDVLEGLDDYFVWMSRLSRHAPDSFNTFSRIGGTVVNNYVDSMAPDIWDWRENPHNLPSMFMISFSDKDTRTDPKDDKICVKVMAFNKVRENGSFIPEGEVFYNVMMFYSERTNHPFTFATDLYVGIKPDGELRVLRVPKTYNQVINLKNQRRSSGERGPVRHFKKQVNVSHYGVGYPEIIKHMYKKSKEDGLSMEDKDIHVFTERLFYSFVAWFRSAESGFQINVRKGTMHAMFGIPASDGPTFFKDRNKDLSATGYTRRIFHNVDAHTRQLADGRTSEVKQHYRGLRKFDWKGYRIAITVPGYHHFQMSKFTAPSIEVDDPSQIIPGTMTNTEVGRLINDRIWNG